MLSFRRGVEQSACEVPLGVAQYSSFLCVHALRACGRVQSEQLPIKFDFGQPCVLRRKWFLVFISFVLTLFDLYGFWSLFDLSLFDLHALGTPACSVFLLAPCFVLLSEFPIF